MGFDPIANIADATLRALGTTRDQLEADADARAAERAATPIEQIAGGDISFAVDADGNAVIPLAELKALVGWIQEFGKTAAPRIFLQEANPKRDRTDPDGWNWIGVQRGDAFARVAP